ncbi:MAG: DUF4080 domain-containing protein [Magnetococcales bacterium]|nr:DUF4080 domain-containing protein [Magnetococcales bacterium]
MIVLVAINARYQHSSLGMRCLLANMGPLQSQTVLLEFDLQRDAVSMAEAILVHQPVVVGIGVYIWNVALCRRLLSVLRCLQPGLTLVVGGPELSDVTADHPIMADVDYVLIGEADQAFGQLCHDILDGQRSDQAILRLPPPDLVQLELPYRHYGPEEIAHRTLYVESSRGCPFHCSFCLSALDHAVRLFPLPSVLSALQDLLDRGARQFKFVDRTFNLNLSRAEAILTFFLDFLHQQPSPDLLLHFEMIPDRLPQSLRQLLQRFPAGTVQLELGIQSFNPDVLQRIGRHQDEARLADNLRWLRQNTGVHLHTDLIAGLPGEDWASLAAGFDQLLALEPHEIQLGILKQLPGTPLLQQAAEQGMIFSPDPPYELLCSHTINFFAMQRIRRLAHYWDSIGNSGRLLQTRTLLLQLGSSPFATLMQLSDWLYATTMSLHGIAFRRLCQLLIQAGLELFQDDADRIHQAVLFDYQRTDPAGQLPPLSSRQTATKRHRQQRHLVNN